MHNWMRSRRKKSQAGISLIELMIAATILVICSLGVLSMIIVAIATNGRNKQDTTKTMLAQAILEKVNSVLVGSASTQLTDCRGNSITVNTAAGGASIVNGTVGGDIDFSQAMSAIPGGAGGDCAASAGAGGYQACYVVTSPCSASGKYVATYDVRWHVDQIGAAAGTPTNTFLVTVGARQTAAQANTNMQGLFFSLPTNLRQFVGKPQ